MRQFLSCIKTAFAVVAMSAVSLSATAEGTHDMGVLVPGETYSFPAFTTVVGQYTPTVTGPVKFKYSTNPLGLYTSPSHSDESIVNGSHSYVEGGQLIAYDMLEAGKTYYIYDPFTMSEGTLVINEGVTELAVTGVLPKLDADEYFSVSDNYTIDVIFNFPIKVTSAWVVAGETRTKVSCSVSNTSASCSVTDALMEMYRNGTLKKGEKMTLRLLGVTDVYDDSNKCNGNGKVEIDFTMADKPGELVETVNASLNDLNNQFFSYYKSGDENGKVTFKFDTDLSTASDHRPIAKISYGNPDNIDLGIYTENISGEVEGKDVVFDFTGKLRRPIDMIPGSTEDTQPDNLFVLFADIFTADGQRVLTGRAANPSGFPVSFKLNVIQYSISSDFTPVRGSDITPGSPMEIWLMNGAYMSFSGVSFEYTSNGQAARTVVPMADITVEEDPLSATDMIYTFTIPEMAIDENTKVTVSLADAECSDGLDHSIDYTAEFGYMTSGIESVESGDSLKKMDVYNIAGVRVLKDASRSALNTLPKGIYIVNGKKIVIK